MAVLKGYITAKAPTRTQISKAYKEFANLIKTRTPNIDTAIDISIFNAYLKVSVGDLLMVFNGDKSRTQWLKNGRVERTIAVDIKIYESFSYHSVGTINLLKVSFFANGLQDDIVGLAEVDDILKMIKEQKK